MRSNYDPYRHFRELYGKQLKKQFDTIFDLKENDSKKYDMFHQHSILRTSKSQRFSVLRQLRSCYEIIKLTDLFEGRYVYDVGSGFGSSYYALRFGKPKKLIAVDPYKENIDIAKQLGYDESFVDCWENYSFDSGSLVFFKGVHAPDFHEFFKRMQDCNVTDIIIMGTWFVNSYLENTYWFRKIENPNLENSRWTYNRPVELYRVPSIGELMRLANICNYGLSYKEPTNNRQGDVIFKKTEIEKNLDLVHYILHFSKIGE